METRCHLVRYVPNEAHTVENELMVPFCAACTTRFASALLSIWMFKSCTAAGQARGGEARVEQ